MSLDTQKLAELLSAMAGFNAAIRSRLDDKLDANATSVNSEKLGGLTLAQIEQQIGGAAAASLQALSDEFDAFVARQDNPHAVTKGQVGLGNVENFGVATDVEAVAGLAADKYLTPANLQAFWADKVGTAPETLDTIQELAAALQNNPDALNALQQIAGDNQAAIADLEAALSAAQVASAADATEKANAAQAAAIDAAAIDATQKADAALVAAKDYTDAAEEGIRTDMESGLASKLGANEKAVDAAKLDGFTREQIIAQAQAGVDMSEVVLKSDDFGQYTIGEETLADLVAALKAADVSNGDSIVAVEDALEAFIASKATSAEVVEGTDDVKYVTSAGAKAAIDAAIAALVDGAPEALDTLRELAEAIGENEGGIADLLNLVGTKLNQAQVQAEIAAVVDPLDARVQAIEAAVGEGSDFLQAGISDLGANPVALLGSEEDEEVKTLKEHLLALKASDEAQGLALSDAVGNINGSLTSLGGRVDTNAAAILAAENAATALEGRVSGIEAALPSKLEAGDDISTNVVSYFDAETPEVPSAQALSTVLESLRQGVLNVQAGASEDLDGLQAAFNAFVAAKATGAEVIAGTDDEKYTTSASVKAAINAAVQDLVGTAPEALDTIKELADALNNDPDIINQLMLQIGGKLGATDQAVDSAKLEGKSLADLTAGNADVAAGTSTEKFVTPAALKSKTDAQDLAIAANSTGLSELMLALAGAFDEAAADIDPTPSV